MTRCCFGFIVHSLLFNTSMIFNEGTWVHPGSALRNSFSPDHDPVGAVNSEQGIETSPRRGIGMSTWKHVT